MSAVRAGTGSAACRPTQQGADAPSGASGLLLAKKQESPPALLVVVHSSDVRRVPDSARSPGHLTGRVLRDTRRRLVRERCPYAKCPQGGSAYGYTRADRLEAQSQAGWEGVQTVTGHAFEALYATSTSQRWQHCCVKRSTTRSLTRPARV
jgi:hypothetical protein